jgi:hypothetical protein
LAWNDCKTSCRLRVVCSALWSKKSIVRSRQKNFALLRMHSGLHRTKGVPSNGVLGGPQLGQFQPDVSLRVENSHNSSGTKRQSFPLGWQQCWTGSFAGLQRVRPWRSHRPSAAKPKVE